MKIRKVDLPSAGPSAHIEKEEPAAIPAKSITFKQRMTDLTAEQHEKFIGSLVNDIKKQGELVCKRADLRELHKYRDMIRQLIDETASNAYSLSRFRKYDGRGRSRTFTLIHKINERLEEMTNNLLKDEVDSLQLLECVDDIQGMLLDLLL